MKTIEANDGWLSFSARKTQTEHRIQHCILGNVTARALRVFWVGGKKKNQGKYEKEELKRSDGLYHLTGSYAHLNTG